MDKKRILVVEDEFVTASDIREALEEMEFEVPGIVDTGEGAVKMAGELKPDLILMDIVLKDEMNGITAAGIIRERFGIPVVFLTGQSDDATFSHALESDPFGYVLKPFKQKELKNSIAMALYKDAMERKLEQKNEELRKLYAALDGMNDYVIITRYAGQIEYVNAAFIERFGYSLGEVLEKDFSVLQAPENQYPVTTDAFIQDSKQVWTGTFYAMNKYGIRF